MATDHIRYDLMVQEALRGVVRKVLGDAARDGLPGEHHFFITFRTGSPGVRLSARMRERYPEEMTVILQHQFWDLAVTEHAFEVGLSFANVPERLLVPYDSVTGFFDPSVQFGLKFETQEAAVEVGANDSAPERPALPAPERTGGRAGDQGKPTRGAGSEPTEMHPTTARKEVSFTPLQPAQKPAAKGKAAEPAKPAPKDAPAEPGAANIVSIDAFRKKP